VNEKYLYVCDWGNDRVQILDKENGNFIYQWKSGQRSFRFPLSILLYEQLFYVGDQHGVQVFTKENQCIQLFGSYGSGKGSFNLVSGVCIVNGKAYIVDNGNHRIQVWD